MIEFLLFLLGVAIGAVIAYVLNKLFDKTPEPKRVSNRTLEEVVREYIDELENKASDPIMKEIYKDWMKEFVDDKV